jgi:putative proteasome-type protease
MTYCVGIHVDGGLVFASDSRTNAGIDHVSTYSKLHSLIWPGERVFVLLSAGNLATTQAVVKKLHQDSASDAPSLRTVATMTEGADYVGRISTELQRSQMTRDASGTTFEATFIFGGQIAGQLPELFMVYPQGNYIHESASHPFLQIGEIKYGKPILDRIIKRDTPLESAARCALVSLNSTIRSNLTVGPPVDLMILPKDALDGGYRLHFNEDEPFYRDMAERWNEGLVSALERLPRFFWEKQN